LIRFRFTTTRKRSLENVVDASQRPSHLKKGTAPLWPVAVLPFLREMLLTSRL
jgi:hypothetical protein